jgi:Cellulase (glycosyl hydrolase family 5)
MRHLWRAALVGALVFGLTTASASARADRPLSTKRAVSVLAGRESGRLRSFTSWLAAGHAHGFIGEVGWPGNPTASGDARWNSVAHDWYRQAARAKLLVAAWATGELWSSGYKLAVYRADRYEAPVSIANPQASVVEGQQALQRGINVDGGAFGEFGAGSNPVAATSPLDNVDVGAYGSVYAYPSAETFSYLAQRGMRTARLAFRWERLERTPGGPLDAAELARLRAAVDAAGRAGLQVVLDCHNYGGYYAHAGSTGVRRALGTPQLPDSAFAGLWRRLATAFRSDPSVLGYGLMNEPTGMAGPRAWERASQAAVDAIRATGDTHRIFVAAYGWDSVTQFARNHARGPWIHDSKRNTWYEAHQYFDQDMSARYRLSFDAEAETASHAG